MLLQNDIQRRKKRPWKEYGRNEETSIQILENKVKENVQKLEQTTNKWRIWNRRENYTGWVLMTQHPSNRCYRKTEERNTSKK